MVSPRNRHEDTRRAGTTLFDRRPAAVFSEDVETSTVHGSQSQPRHGRLRERETLLGELRASFRGLTRLGPTVIEGVAGFGKTALLNAACRAAREEQLTVLMARGNELEASFAFGAVRQLFEPILALLDPAQRDACLNELGTGVLISSGTRGTDDLLSIFESLRSAISYLANSQPLVIAVDDLHLCDQASALWFEYMSRRLEHNKIWLIGSTTTRMDVEARPAIDRIAADAATRYFFLEPLSESSVADLVAEQYAGVGLAELAQELCRATRGNPFLLFSLLSWLRSNGFDTPTDAVQEVPRSAPPAIIRSLTSRVRKLPPGADALLQAIAVLGGEAGLREASGVAELDVQDAQRAADALAELNIVGRDRPLTFIYPAERAAVYWDMGPASRANLHARSALLLHAQGSNPRIVAEHLLLSERRGEAWRAEALVEAAALARQDGEFELARKYLVRALDEPPNTSYRGEVLISLAGVEASLGSLHSVAFLLDAGECEVDPARYATAILQTLKAFSNEIAPRDGLDLLRNATERTAGILTSDLRLRLEIGTAYFDRTMVGTRRAATVLEALLDGRTVGRSREERLALAYLCGTWVLAPDRLGAAQLAAIALQSVAGEDLEVADAPAVEGMIRALEAATYCGSLADVVHIARNGQITVRRLGISEADAAFSAVLAQALLQSGNLRDAETEAREAASSVHPLSRGRQAMSLVVKSLLEQGQMAEAALLVDELCRMGEGAESLGQIQALECRGELRYLEGAYDAALGDFEAAGQLAEVWDVRNPAVTGWRAGEARVLYALGDFRRSHEFASENLSLARTFGAPLHVGAALRVMAEVVEPNERLALLDEAVNLLEPTGATLELSRTTLELGRTLREGGRHVAARSALRQAADLAVRCGASRLIDRALRELRASGARPRRLVFSGTDALTPSERRVAALAAAGMKNSRIAEELFVSPKTVEGHLSRVYQKLGIQSREDLRAVVSQVNDDRTRRVTRHSA